MFGFSRQAYYQHSHRLIKGEEADKQVLDLIEAVRKDHPRMGGKKLYWLLKEELGQRAGPPVRNKNGSGRFVRLNGG